jgi:hypothetical protein
MKEYTKITGDMTIGSRAIMIDGDIFKNSIPNSTETENIVSYAKEQNDNSLMLASSSRFAMLNSDHLCYYCYRKFYYPLDDESGLYIFASIVQPNRKITDEKLFKRYLSVAKSYEKRNIYPKIFSIGKIELDFNVNHIDDPKKVERLNLTAFAMKTKRIHTPGYKLDTSNKKHMYVLKKIWGKKRTRPYELDKNIIIALYGKDFYKTNKKTFNKDSYTKFKHKIRYIAHRLKTHKLLWDPAGKKLRQLDLKYGNILYCTKEKLWYYIDFG